MRKPWGATGWVVVGMLLLIGCGRTPERQHEEAQTSIPMPVYFSPIGAGNYARVEDTVETVIYNSRTWKRWKEVFRWVEPPLEPDFQQAMVILIAIPAPRAGYWVQVETVEETEDSLRVTYTLTEPASDCLIAEVPTVAFQAVLARRVEKPVRFFRHIRYESCEV